MLFEKNFIKSVPIEKRKLVKEKLIDFEKVILNATSYEDIPSGYWIRRVEGTDIYKFRVNSGDRVLFKIDKEFNDKKNIVFLEFCNHDEQIRRAKNYVYKEYEEINLYDIDTDTYIEDEYDEVLNDYVINELNIKLKYLKNNIVVDDEYISISAEYNDVRDMKFLSNIQYECIKYDKKPLIVNGCAGSGKTLIAIKKAYLNASSNIKTIYITCSDITLKKTISIYENMDTLEENDNVKFCTLYDLCIELLNEDVEKLIGFDEFKEWYELSIGDSLKEINVREIWIEINSIIKGSSEKKLSREEYISNLNSAFSKDIKSKIYKISNLYDNWIKNQYYDLNDLISIIKNKKIKIPVFDYVICDESQEFTKKQIEFIINLAKDKNNITLLGDKNQSINSLEEDNRYKSIFENDYNSIKILNNYRCSCETIELINKIKKLKSELLNSEDKRYFETGLKKNDRKPEILYNSNQEEKIFKNVDNDVNSIIIVLDDSDVEEIKNIGYPSGRIFTVEEVRGIEYQNIYCYNIMSKIKKEIDNIFNDNITNTITSRVYFNMLYIAITRSLSNLCFLESEKTELSKELEGYMSVINEEDIIQEEVEVDKAKWLEEAKNLEKMQKFKQAADAYKKAGEMDLYDKCIKANKRKINYFDVQENKTLIELKSDNQLKLEKVEYALRMIEDTYGISIKGNVGIYYQSIRESANRTSYKYIKNIEQLAKYIIDSLEDKMIRINRVILETCLYKDGNPYKILKDYEQQDLIIDTTGEIFIEEDILDEARYQLENQEIRKYDLKADIMGLVNVEEDAEKSADDIINDILNG